jgi:hypothetical protein
MDGSLVSSSLRKVVQSLTLDVAILNSGSAQPPANLDFTPIKKEIAIQDVDALKKETDAQLSHRRSVSDFVGLLGILLELGTGVSEVSLVCSFMYILLTVLDRLTVPRRPRSAV